MSEAHARWGDGASVNGPIGSGPGRLEELVERQLDFLCCTTEDT